MSSLYMPVRIATLAFSGILFILGAIDLVNELKGNFYDRTYVAQLGITVIILILTAWGSFKHNRVYLLTGALILTSTIVFNFFTTRVHYSPLGTNVVVIVLALVQSELIRRGY